MTAIPEGFVIESGPSAPPQAFDPADTEIQGLRRAPMRYQPEIGEASRATGIETPILTEQIRQESRFNPNAVGPVTRSGDRALGISQFMPATARERGVDPMSPESAIPGGAQYLAQMKKQFGGNDMLALMAYNWGPGNVQKWVQSGADPARVPNETKKYVAEIMQRAQQPTMQAQLPPGAQPAAAVSSPQIPPGFEIEQGPAQSPMSPGMASQTASEDRAREGRIQPRMAEHLQTAPQDRVAQGMLMGWGDEVGAELSSRFNPKGLVRDEELDARRRANRQFETEHPVAAPALEIGGALATAPLIPMPLAASASRIARGAGAAVTGAATGAIYGAGAGETPEERMKGAETGALIGGPVGAVAGAILPAARTGLAPKGLGAQSVESAERLGLENYPKIAAVESPALKSIGTTIAKVPFAGTRVISSIEKSVEELGAKANQVAQEIALAGAPKTRAEAGTVIREGVEDYIKNVSAKNAQKLYDKVDALVDNTVTTPLTNTAQVAQEITARRSAANLKGPGGVVDKITEAVSNPAGLTYEGIKDLRTAIGEDVKRGLLPEGMSQAELAKVYGALSADLAEATKRAGGPDAVKAFQRANDYYRLVSERRGELAKVLGTRSDETLYDSVLRMASAKGGADLASLSQVRKAIKNPDEWAEIASAAVARMGQTIKGNVETFNPATFVKDYGNLTPQGKAILFNSAGKATLRQSLDDIAAVSRRLADLRYSNPSGTAQPVISSGLGALGGIEAVMGGGIPWMTLTGLLTTNGVARLLTTPATARSMARWSMAYEGLVKKPTTGTIAGIRIASRNFASTVGSELGLSGTQISNLARQLQGPVAGRAEDEPQ